MNIEKIKSLFEMGDDALLAGDYYKAFYAYDVIVNLDSKSSDAYIGRGAALRGLGDLDHAIDDFSEAIKLDPNRFEAYTNRGNVLLKKGNLDQAIKDWSK